MKSLIVYYSMSGNCEYVARTIASYTGCDVLELEPVKAYPREGFKKFLVGGRAAVFGEIPPLKPYSFDASKYDRVIFSFPVWASRVAPPIKSFIVQNRDKLEGKKFSAAITQGGSGGEKALAKLVKMLGVDSLEKEIILIEPKTRPEHEKDLAIKAFCDAFNE
ncbi:MAG: flavodoxin family protein [Firmicutes bacterium]|nr:flavodoxin family protein [Bacillota bacterium]